VTLTATYSRIHRAIAETANELGIEPRDVRLLLAIAELGGERVSSDQLEQAMEYVTAASASAARRSLTMFYLQGLATGIASDGGKRRPGVRSLITLTETGRSVAVDVAERVEGIVS
jgi:CO/xanthine dehydrogenase Mo-binding subunit